MLRSQAEHHAGTRFLLLLSDTCGERPAKLTSRTATSPTLDPPPRLCRLPQYRASPAAPLRRGKKRPHQANGRIEGPPVPRLPRPQMANHSSERLIGVGIADQLVSSEAASEPIESQRCPSCFTAEFRGLQPRSIASV